jgi:hypothetical protein
VGARLVSSIPTWALVDLSDAVSPARLDIRRAIAQNRRYAVF